MASEQNLLDAINRRILEELQHDGRIAFAELGRRVDLSAVGYQLAAVVRTRPFARQLPKIPEVAAATPEVVECERITGEDCFLVRLHVRAMEDLEGVLDRFTPF